MSTAITGTFMFTDLVGSTALAARLGPEATEEVRQAHYAILRGAAAATGGIEVKSTGDGVMLMFTGPSRALSCAAAIQQGIERYNRRAVEPLAVRIGLSMGEAVEDDGDYYGDCVVEAARLCDKATGGQILATEVLRAIVGRHSAHGFASVGALDLKGIPEAVPAVEVLWEPEAVAGEIALPARLVGAATEGLFGFFGRVEELDALLGAAARAREEARTEVVLLAGEPGIGKTTLSAQAARTLHGEGATVLFGHCAEGLAIPYQPWIEALGHFVALAPDDVLRDHVDAHGPVLARLLPGLTRRIPDAQIPDASVMADGERYALFEAIRGLLTAASADGLVIVLDDVQWADNATLQVLRHLLTGGTPPSMLVVATYRDSDLSRDHLLTPFLADLHREPWVTRIPLRGLSDKELLELMEGAAGYEMDAEGLALAQALYRETDGNPFFTGEMLRHLFETGAIAFDESGRYVLTIDLAAAPLPGSVRDVVMRRVDRLGDDVNGVLTLASVIGRDFDLAVLSAIADTDEDTLLDLLEACTNAALITEVGELPGRFRFEHALIQHSLYQDLGATRRQRLHQRIGEALESLAGDHAPPIADLAHHWLAATRPSDARKAIEYARLAGEAATEALAFDDAIGWYTQALDLQERVYPDDAPLRIDLLTCLGAAQRQAGMPSHVDTLLEAGRLAGQIDDSERLTRAALTVASETMDYTFSPERYALVEDALSRAEPNSAVAARLYSALACETDPTDWRSMADRAERALEIARGAGDDEALLHTLLTWASVCAGPDGVEARIQAMEHAAAMAERLGDEPARFLALYQLSWAKVETGDSAGGYAAFDLACEIAESLHLPFQDWQVLIVRCSRAALAGALDEAEALADGALALANRAGFSIGLGAYVGQLSNIRGPQGRGDELVEFLVAASEAVPGVDVLRTTVIRLLIATGDDAAARVRFRKEQVRDFDIARTQGWLPSMENLADAAADLEERAGAERLLELMRPFTSRLVPPIGIPPRPIARPAGRLAALLGDSDLAEALFASALDVCDRLGAPYFAAATLVDRAEMCLRRDGPGDGARAEADIAAALALATPIGAAAIPQRVERLRAR